MRRVRCVRPVRLVVLALCAVAGAAALTSAVATPSALARGGKGKDVKDPVVEAFDTSFGSDDAKVRAEAVTALRDAPDAVKVDLIATRVVGHEERADVLSRAVEILSRVREPDAVLRIVGAARSGKLESRLIFVEALAGLDGTEAHTALLEIVKDREPRLRGMAAYGLGRHRAMDALDPLLALLDNPAWQVQVAALEAIPRLTDKDVLRQKAAPVLVEFLANTAGRISVDCAAALAKITGRRLGRDADVWRRYIDEGVEPEPPKGSGDGDGDAPAASAGAYANQAEKPHFYGMEVTSHRVALLLDISLSMNDPIEIDKARLRRETSRRRAITGNGADNAEGKDDGDEDKNYDIPWWRIKTRLDLAREQTILLISQLDEDQFFDIIFFSNEVEPWMGRLVPANSANKQKAIAQLQTLKPDEKTNTWGALAAAFDLMDNDKKSYELGPDELYLVTDGQPSIGDIVDPDQILDAVLQLHKSQPIRVNCIGIGVNLRFMKKMCRETGGEAKFFE